MVSMENENAIHRARKHRADHVVLGRHRIDHVQEILGVGQLVARIHEGLSDRVLVGHRRNRRHLGDEPVRRDHALARIRDVGAVMIEGRQCADDADHDRHGVGIAPEAAIEVHELLVHHRVIGDVVHEALLLRLVRQFPEQQQVRDLREIAVFGQILDAVAAMQQDAFVAVDEGDLRLAAAG